MYWQPISTAHHTDNGLRIKSATTRGGTIEDIYFQNCTMDSVRNVFSFTLNWNPAYSYSELPKGYNYETIPAHWKSMLQKVTPVEKGIPHAKDIYVNNLKVTNAQNIFTASGLEQSWLTNFVYSNSTFQWRYHGTDGIYQRMEIQQRRI
jgi:polygalacturonase